MLRFSLCQRHKTWSFFVSKSQDFFIVFGKHAGVQSIFQLYLVPYLLFFETQYQILYQIQSRDIK